MKEIVLALSGGVDSAMCVHYLQEQGYKVHGFTFLVGDDREKREMIVRDAKKVADFFHIDLEIADLSQPFTEKVSGKFLEEYLRGRTPNPCVRCNRWIKFPFLLAAADRMGIETVATGHYISMREGMIYRCSQNKKEQSYVLALLPREFLPRLYFPLGNRRKEELREEAQQLRLPVANKADSQEICFVPGDDYRAYIRRMLSEPIACGDFVDQDGNVLGRHQGLPFYTVGQRKGLGIAFGRPLYVTRLDASQNRVYLGEARDLLRDAVILEDVNLFLPELEGQAFAAEVKIRYQSATVAAKLAPLDGDRYLLTFATPQKSVTPGQIAVFYRDDMLLGGGVIA